jgi:hypothetical protein
MHFEPEKQRIILLKRFFDFSARGSIRKIFLPKATQYPVPYP